MEEKQRNRTSAAIGIENCFEPDYNLQLRQVRLVIKSAIKERGLSYRQVAKATGFSLLKFRRLMSVQDFKVIELFKILNVLGYDEIKLKNRFDLESTSYKSILRNSLPVSSVPDPQILEKNRGKSI